MTASRHIALPLAALLAGLAGAVAMIPVGLALNAAGLQVNRYGEVLARQLTGGAAPAMLLAQHMLIGALSALPLGLWAVFVRPVRTGVAMATGAAYGVGYWFVINALALPWLYGRPHPWTEGPAAVWPSLVAHVVYGVVAALVLGAMMQRRAVASATPRSNGQGGR